MVDKKKEPNKHQFWVNKSKLVYKDNVQNIGCWSEREVCETWKDETIKIFLNIRKIQIKNHQEVSYGTANSLNKRLYNFFSL